MFCYLQVNSRGQRVVLCANMTNLIVFIYCGFRMLSGLKQIILVQLRQNGYETVPFSVYIHNLMFVSIWSKCSEKSLGTVAILPLMFSSLKPCFVTNSWILLDAFRDVLVQENDNQLQVCLHSSKCMYKKNSQLYILHQSSNYMMFKNDHLLHFPVNLHFVAVWRGQGLYSLLTGTVSKDSVALST